MKGAGATPTAFAGPARRFALPLGVGAAVLVLAAAIMLQPAAAVGLVAVSLIVVAGAGSRLRLHRFYLAAMAGALVGYAVLGRGFAALGVPPVYVGEAVLGLGVIALTRGGGLVRVLRSPVAWPLVALAMWGVARTAPYLGVHGMDALRDAVVWAYSAFALLTAAALLRTGWWRRLPVGLARVVPWFVVALSAAYVVSELADESMEGDPGPLLAWVPQLKAGDVAVHLAGAAAFLLLGLQGLGPRRSRNVEWLAWIVWVAAFTLASTQNRGGMVAALAALGLVALLRPSLRLARLGIAAMMIIAVGLIADFRFELEHRREVSLRQVASNVASVFGEVEEDPGLRSTVEWRSRWWGDIVDYTVGGPYFWTGKGFGLNLADEDGYQTEADHSLRSPHSAHLTVLARMGVPGLSLWILWQVTFAALLVRAWSTARRRGADAWARINLWILAYWVAFTVNGAFDVYLEGPLGGIWHWTLVGFGIAALEVQRRDHARAPEELDPEAPR